MDKHLLTTKDFIEIIKKNDPKQNKTISFCIKDGSTLLASGEIYDADCIAKYCCATQEGDKDILRVTLQLDEIQPRWIKNAALWGR